MAMPFRKSERPPTAVATRLLPPAEFRGTPTQWRVLTETIWPGAKSAEAIQLALGYCAVRHLDPFKRPVHIVPVWNSSLRREVETVWPGINELLTTAARSQSFAGVDAPEWGPDQTHSFAGVGDNDKPVRVEVTFPAYCVVRVWRNVQGERRSFSAPVFWQESYGRRSFRSELPNTMWEKRPRGQLHKCALAASLRLAFPEDLGSEYSAEEMEGREISAGGVVIDGNADSKQEQQEVEEQDVRLALLNESNGTVWMRSLQALLDSAQSADEVAEIAGHRTVNETLAADSKAPTLIRENIRDALRKAHERFAVPDTTDSEQEWGSDPTDELLREIDSMDAIALAGLHSNAQWRAKVKAMTRDFPPELERIEEHIQARRAALRGGNKG